MPKTGGSQENRPAEKDRIRDFLINLNKKKAFDSAKTGIFSSMVSKYYTLSKKQVDEFADKLDWYGLSHNPHLPWSEELIEKYKKKLSWYNLSKNPTLPWSYDFIVKYEDWWDFGTLSTNPGLPWSEQLIDRYLDKWEWGKVVFYSDSKPSIFHGLSSNSGLPWSVKFIDKIKNTGHGTGPDFLKITSSPGLWRFFPYFLKSGTGRNCGISWTARTSITGFFILY